MVFAGWGMIRYLATTNTLLQLAVDEGYRGRMMGLHAVMFLGTQTDRRLRARRVAQQFGARRAALVSASTALAAAAWLAFRPPAPGTP